MTYVSGSIIIIFFTAMEAMACMPCSNYSHVGVLEYAINDVNVLLCDVAPEQLANAMLKLVLDIELLNKLIATGLPTVRNYRWAYIIPQIAAYYKDVSHWTPATKGELSRRKIQPDIHKP